jgi:hypothetical protein
MIGKAYKSVTKVTIPLAPADIARKIKMFEFDIAVYLFNHEYPVL